MTIKPMAFFALAAGIFSAQALAHKVAPHGDPPEFYRKLTESIRKQATFKVFLPGGSDLKFSYNFALGDPVYEVPLLHDIHWDPTTEPEKYYRIFWDRILFAEESFLTMGDEKIPLTCVFVHGQDNRYGKPDRSPLFPDYVLKVYLVANDFSCTGPINPGYPSNGGKKETWDTYIYYEVRDPTIMQPTEIKIRYRWNEFNAVLIDGELAELKPEILR